MGAGLGGLCCAAEAVPVLLELGGKSANIVFPDTDVSSVVSNATYFGAEAFSGQACSRPTRLLCWCTTTSTTRRSTRSPPS
ncbi:MAG: aldehyde dehydrogenase family protein [Mycobacterium sp.]